ncbi:glycogen synthase GlgA [Sphingomonas radiodurans]|uniref:glycogen synthase GlgA n=1 Tax=Sphingomonas radiodurans TaxID=2890321 RepID=UPI001E606F74|nr:glycogen synthase GlgA [Sphingomonas radiodurans]WBH16924.1 glycogen synthase GlgA [Sphingomonas radiodurans]
MRVLSVASEAYPLIKTGGLADVVGALPAALTPHAITTTTLLPGYPAVLKATTGRPIHKWRDLLGTEARLLRGDIAGHPLLVLDAPTLYARDGGPYADATGQDWPDNWRRFAALAYAAADIASSAVKNLTFDILHAHDWQAALAPAYLRYAAAPVKSVVTVHNIAFQGRFDAAIFDELGLPPEAWSIDGVEYYGGVGFLKAGLEAADAITTVSPTYAREILQPEFGMGLEGLIATRAAEVHGIVNGIDPAVWSPEHDPALPARYTARTLARRAANKRAVERTFGLDAGNGPIATVISRLTWQKGMDVLADCLDDLVAMGGRLALLGSGDAALEQAFLAAAERHPGRIGVRIGYDEPVSHLLQGGADAILIPSRFEPCGLTQLYGLAYGCVPVVARTGGLADTIIDANAAALAAGVATGIQFDGVTRESLIHALRRLIALYADPLRWQTLQRRGMGADFSWGTSGAAYAALCRGLIEA